MGAPKLKPAAHMTVVSKKGTTVIVNNSKIAEGLFRDIWEPDTMNRHERVYAVYLSSIGEVIDHKLINIGNRTETVLCAQTLVYYALQCEANCIMIAHNHPSGICEPSPQDIAYTKKLKEVLIFLEVPLREHMILTKDKYYSFADYGTIN